MDTTGTSALIADTGDQLQQVLATFTAAQLNTAPYKDSWTAGQVAGHILKFCGTTLLYGNTAATDRAADELIPGIRELFLDFSIKMNAPDFVLPEEGTYTATIQTELEQAWEQLHQAVRTLDLHLLCLDFELPGFGALTRLEWVWFMMIHTQRHIRQLQEIRRLLS
jgi:hypothetical protein